MLLPATTTPLVLPVRATEPSMVSPTHADPAAPPPSRTGPVASVTDTEPPMAVPHTAARRAGRLADSGPCSFAAWIKTSAPAVIVTGPVMTAPGFTQVGPGPIVSDRSGCR